MVCVYRLRKLPLVTVAPKLSTSVLIGPLGKVEFPRLSSFFSKSLLSAQFAIYGQWLHGLGLGFFSKFNLTGVGYKVYNLGSLLLFDLGLNGFFLYTTPVGIKVIVRKASMVLFSVSPTLLFSVAAQLTSLRRPDPYKGKGVILEGVGIRLKKRKKDGK